MPRWAREGRGAKLGRETIVRMAPSSRPSRHTFMHSLLGGSALVALPMSALRRAQLEGHGTLITIVPTRDGLVVGADRRT